MSNLTLNLTHPKPVLSFLEPMIRESYAEMYGDPDEAGDLDPSLFVPGRGGLVAAHVDGMLAGCAGWTWISNCNYPPEAIPASWPTATVELKRLFVRPQFRGMGVAKALVEARFDSIWATSAELAVGETGGAQTISKQLHSKAGWVEVEPFGLWKDNPESAFFGKWRADK